MTDTRLIVCDRCGRKFIPTNEPLRVVLQTIEIYFQMVRMTTDPEGLRGEGKLHLCPQCKSSFVDWFKS